MAPSLIIHTDCRQYEGSKPCAVHKRDGRLCDGCADYDPVTSRILIVKLAAVGDVLRTTSILPALKQKYPGCEITWVTRSNASPLLGGNPLIDRVLTVEEHYLPFLSNETFAAGMCLDADPLAATILSRAECLHKFGFTADVSGRLQPVNERAQEWWYMGLNDTRKRCNRKTYNQILYEICDLPLPTRPPQLNITDSMARYGESFRTRNDLTHAHKVLGVNTGGGARWQHKKWTFEGYIRFMKMLKDRHPEVGIVLLGGPEEVELNGRIMETLGDTIVDAGCSNSLTDFSSIINALDVLLTSDSLAMHIGVALGKATVVLVGPTSPWELDVFGKGDIVHSGIECLVCYRATCDKLVTCMNTLSPERIVSTVEHYL